MLVFKPNEDNKKLVRHLNGNPEDNNVENLCYGTHQENYFDFYLEGKGFRKLSINDVYKIREQLKACIPKAQIARNFSITVGHVHNISIGRCYGWLN